MTISNALKQESIEEGLCRNGKIGEWEEISQNVLLAMSATLLPVFIYLLRSFYFSQDPWALLVVCYVIVIFCTAYFFLLKKLKSYDVQLEREKEINAQVCRENHYRLVGKTSQILAHDLRKPFTMIQSILTMFENFKDDPVELEAARRDIERAILNVESSMADISEFTKTTMLLSVEDVSSVMSTLSSCLLSFVEGFSGAPVVFEYDLRHTRMPFMLAPRFERVIYKILKNCFDALGSLKIEDEKKIWFESFEEGDQFVLKIRNSGPPLDEQLLPQIFNTFMYAPPKKRGLGLGLAIVQKMLSLHGGHIAIENSAKGGVEVTIRLPLSAQEEPFFKGEWIFSTEHFRVQKGHEAPRLKLVKDNGLHILLLEDEALYRLIVKKTFALNKSLFQNVIIHEATTVEEAKEILDREPISHAIVDIDLGQEENGFDFLHYAKEHFPNIKSMIHSNRFIQSDRDEAFALGAISFINKPLTEIHLKELLKDYLIYEYVFIDDDELFTKVWRAVASKKGINCLTLSSLEEFHRYEDRISKDKTKIYLDCNFEGSTVTGDQFAQTLYQQGHQYLFLATGHDKEQFSHLPWLQVVGKRPPF